MTEAEWVGCNDPKELIPYLPHPRSERKLFLWGFDCCSGVAHLLSDVRGHTALEVAASYAEEGTPDCERLRAASESAVAARVDLFQSAPTTPGGGPDAGGMAKAVTLDAIALLLSPRFPHEASAVGGMAALAIRREALHRSTPDEMWRVADREETKEKVRQADILRDIFGNPFRPVVFDPAWWTDTTSSLARGMYESRDFSAMPILADALQDAGCDSDDVLEHCRRPGAHVRGCWVVDLVLCKE